MKVLSARNILLKSLALLASLSSTQTAYAGLADLGNLANLPGLIDQASDSVSIIGGAAVTAKDPVFKSTVLLYDGKYICTGSIIASDLIVTAAHCVTDPRKMLVHFKLNIQAQGPTAKLIGALVHPSYGKADAAGRSNHDIALLRISGALPAGYAPAKLLGVKDHLANGEQAILAGYGITSAQPQKGAGTLMKTQVAIHDAQFSATEVLLDQTQGHGACHGDSGGPAFAVRNGQLVLWGVTSRGYPDNAPDDCAHQSVYTKINGEAAFVNWAAKNLQAVKAK